jgi:hypothetical protein
VWANATAREACQKELREALEDWLTFRASRGMTLPVVDGMELSVKELA